MNDDGYEISPEDMNELTNFLFSSNSLSRSNSFTSLSAISDVDDDAQHESMNDDMMMASSNPEMNKKLRNSRKVERHERPENVVQRRRYSFRRS